jgi:lipopolysaccharide heptosyltransferase I
MDFARTLIIKPSSMGDVVQALPVLTALREAHGDAHISWLVGRPFAGLLEGHPRLDELVVFDRGRFAHIGKSLPITGEFLAFLKDLRRRRFTLVIDLQGLFRSGVFAMATGAPTRVGFRAARELAPLFYTHQVSVPRKDMHAVDRYMAVAQRLGLPLPEATDHLPVPQAARAAARERLAASGLAPRESFVAVCAHARWETKQWPPERFAQVLDRVRTETGARAVLVGGAAAVAVGGRLGQTMAERPIDLTDKTTLKELTAVIAEARALVTNDSGPMHVAAAVGTPVVAVFGPTNPVRTGPYGPGHRVIVGRAPCAPCYRRRCLYAGRTQALECLASVTAEDVARCLIDVLRRGAPG